MGAVVMVLVAFCRLCSRSFDDLDALDGHACAGHGAQPPVLALPGPTRPTPARPRCKAAA
jgi:hypothetical protein